MKRSLAHPNLPLLALAGAVALVVALAWSSPAAAFVVCGNGVCEPNGHPFGEDCEICPQDCGGSCTICGNGFCTSPESCSSCSQDCGTCPNQTDSDGDGVTDDVDNCIYTANASQADCDGDGTGDACDDVDGTYQAVYGPVICAIQGGSYGSSSDAIAYYQTRYSDTSSCNSPDIWGSSGTEYHYCSWTGYAYNCCTSWFGGYYCSLYYGSWQCNY